MRSLKEIKENVKILEEYIDNLEDINGNDLLEILEDVNGYDNALGYAIGSVYESFGY